VAHDGASATNVGAWWGPALHSLRRRGERSSEEIDVVGTARGRVTVVGEARWTRRRLDATVLGDLEDDKLPALRQAGFRIAGDVRTVLFSRAGYTTALRNRAASDDGVILVDVPDALA